MATEFTPQRRRPGRPSKAEVAAREAAAAEGKAVSAPHKADKPIPKRVAETRKRRRRRDALGDEGRLKLSIAEAMKDPNYEYRWINDTLGGRMTVKTKFDDWDPVTTSDLEGYEQNARDVSEGTQIKRVAGQAGSEPLYSYLCRKPKEFFEEDKQAKLGEITDIEDRIRQGPLPDPNGLDMRTGYVPEDGISISRGS